MASLAPGRSGRTRPRSAGLLGGAVLLMAGGRMVRPAVGLAGLLAGAVVGAKMLAPELAGAGFNGPSELVGTLGGAAGGCVLALLTFRLLMALAGGATVAALSCWEASRTWASPARRSPTITAQDVIASTPIDTDEALAYRAAADGSTH